MVLMITSLGVCCFLGSQVSPYSKVLGSDEGIKLIYPDGNVIGTILVNVDGITLGIYVVT